MLIDARNLDDGAKIRADLCVVGAGAAGITLTRQLARTGLSIVLLESGAFDFDQPTQDLYGGTASGAVLEPEEHYLTASRLRYFGGTTNHWNGWCRPLDAEDFDARDGVEYSGWPIDRSALDLYYREAAPLLQIGPFGKAREASQRRPFLLDADASFETTFFHVSQPTRFGKRYLRLLRGSETVRVILLANVTEIVTDESGSRVERLDVATLEGGRFTVEASAYVLAAGGIENARLLLVSRGVQEKGLGNGNDLVGACFMEHPILSIGYLLAPDPRYLVQTYNSTGTEDGQRIRGLLRPKAEAQREHGLLNSLVILWKTSLEKQPELTHEVAVLLAQMADFADSSSEPMRAARHSAVVGIATEQVPNLTNRVRLTDERDALGLPRVSVDCHLSATDVDSVQATADLLAREVGASLRGRMWLVRNPDQPWNKTAWSGHHIGTTRMHQSPSGGVVDADCKVHGAANLWVAGSSVFPTSGCSNPTLSIVAMSLRLAEHLTGVLHV